MKKKFFFSIIGSLLIIIIPGCHRDIPDLDFKQEMRNFVQALSSYARTSDPDFIIIPQNGQELITLNGDNKGSPDLTYLSFIDGQGREDLFYGYDDDNQATPSEETEYMTDFLDLAKESGLIILVTDYCSSTSKMDDSYSKNNSRGYVSFAASHRELDNIPSYPTSLSGENNTDINSLNEIKNFLYLINPDQFASKQDFINAVTSTNYDLLIMDLFFNEEPFSNTEVEMLRNKANGGKRLVVSYLSIGEAEDYRYYWKSSWKKGDPEWLYKENPDWEGNYKVKYWMDEWKQIIYGGENAYLDKILDSGFDGAYLDIIDAFEYFEEL
jgi:cysteinyl-tRNA synthetase, unknown class